MYRNKILKIFLILQCVIYAANELYYDVDTKECTIPMQIHMKESVDKGRYISTLLKKPAMITSFMILETNKINKSSLSIFKKPLAKRIKVGDKYLLYYYCTEEEKIQAPEKEKLKSFVLELGKTTIIGTVLDMDYVNYLVKYCEKYQN